MAGQNITDHPVFREIQGFDLPDKSQCFTAFMVYLKLCEDKGWWNVRCHSCEELSKVFLSGHQSRNKPREIVLTVSVECTISPEDMLKYTTMKWLPDYDIKGVTLAIVAGDSSTVFYKLQDGLIPPDPPDVTEWKKYRREETPALKRHHIGEHTADYIQKALEQQEQQQQQFHQQQQQHENQQQQQQHS